MYGGRAASDPHLCCAVAFHHHYESAICVRVAAWELCLLADIRGVSLFWFGLKGQRWCVHISSSSSALVLLQAMTRTMLWAKQLVSTEIYSMQIYGIRCFGRRSSILLKKWELSQMKAGQVDTGRFYFLKVKVVPTSPITVTGNPRVTESVSNVSGSQFPPTSFSLPLCQAS